MSSDKNDCFKMETSFLWWNVWSDMWCTTPHVSWFRRADFCSENSLERAWDEEKGPRVVHLTPHTSMPGDHMEAKHTDVMWVKTMDGTYEGCLLNTIFQALNWPGTTLQNSLCKINQDCCNLDSMMHFSIHLLVSSSPPSPPPMRSLSAACTSDPNPPYD